VNGKPITILELTGLPPEVVNVVVSVLCRMAFDFALWGEGKVPVTVVCEEAHRYVPLNPQMGFEPCKRALAKIAKEGRKYGCSLCIVTQRPAEIDPTILSQCNTVFALRMSNDRDQAIVASAVADTGTGLIEFLPALGAREAIAFGDGVPIPVRIKFDEMPAHVLPRSTTARFSEKWQESLGDESFLDAVVERWRAAGVTGQLDATAQAQLFAEAVNIPMGTGLPRRAESNAADRLLAERAVPERPSPDRIAPDRMSADRMSYERPSYEHPPLDRHQETSFERDPYASEAARASAPSEPPPSSGMPLGGFRSEAVPRRSLAPADIPRAAPPSYASAAPPRYAPPPQAPAASEPAAPAANPRLALRERLLKPHLR
jgi:hypothetical protein